MGFSGTQKKPIPIPAFPLKGKELQWLCIEPNDLRRLVTASYGCNDRRAA
jgi:hypothetical protein